MLTAETIREEVERRLREIRRDPQRLMRYDRNGDGHIDAEEWAEVRRVVEAEIRGEIARQNRRSARPYTVPGVVSAPCGGDILEVLQGRFELIEKIGQGSQGQAFVGRDRHSDELVLVKEMHMAQVAEWKAVELYERESRTLKDLSHEAIPRFIDAFYIDADGGGEGGAGMRIFLVQEFIEGKNLQELIDEGLTVDEAGARAFLREMLDILDYLHTRPEPVIHRDIKPANIIRRTDLRMALVDFGAVQSAQMESSVKTVVGTSGYMPMEQLMGRATPASDLYALGATVVHLLSRRHPADLPVVGMQMQFKDYINVSPRLCEALEIMLAVHLEDRFQSAREVMAFLDAPTDLAAEDAGGAMIDFRAPDRVSTSSEKFFSMTFDPQSAHETAVDLLRAAGEVGKAMLALDDRFGERLPVPGEREMPVEMRSLWQPQKDGFSLTTPIRRWTDIIGGQAALVTLFGGSMWFLIISIGSAGASLGLKALAIGGALLVAIVSVWLMITHLELMTKKVFLSLNSGQLTWTTRNIFRQVQQRTMDVAAETSVACYRKSIAQDGSGKDYVYHITIRNGVDELVLGPSSDRREQLYLYQEIERYFSRARARHAMDNARDADPHTTAR